MMFLGRTVVQFSFPFVCLYVQSDIVTMISHEQHEQFW